MRIIKSIVIILSFILLKPALAMSSGVILSWTWPNDSRVIGVKIYYGTTPYDLFSQNSIDAGYNTSISLSEFDLPVGVIYILAVSYDIYGNESMPSETISYHNYLCGNGWSIVDAYYYLGADINLDYDGDGYTNINDPDIDGDGLSNLVEIAYWGDNWNADPDNDGFGNIFDYDSDGDGFSDNDDPAPSVDYNLRYRDHLYTLENNNNVFVGLTIFPISRITVCKTLNLTNLSQRNIIFGNDDEFPITMENKGNLDNQDGEEIAVTLENISNGERRIETRDIITGELYGLTDCNILEIDSFFFFYNGSLRFAELGFCESSQRTIVRIIDCSSWEKICDIEVLNPEEHALDFGYYSDINGDNLPDIVVSRIPSGSTPEFYSVADQSQIIVE